MAALACTAVAAIALPTAAAARTKVVWAGGPASFQKTMFNKYGGEALDFFPHAVTVNVGDTISWQGMSIGFHTIDIPPKIGRDLPLILPTGTKVSGANDFNGNPFWFNGLPNVGFNPALFRPSGGHTYNGSARVDSGLPLGPPAAFKVTFKKLGTYAYFCNVHYDMRGIIVVLAKGKPTPSPAQDAATVANQVKKDLKLAKALTKTKVPAKHVSLGVSGKNNVELLAMFPATQHVKTGTTVTFAMSLLTGEAHTATFGPKAYLMPLANSFNGPGNIAPAAVYPSSPSGPVPVPGPHGNGFANSGVLDRDPTTPQPPSATFTFTKPGTYVFHCLIHPFMHGTVIVG